LSFHEFIFNLEGWILW